jgi:predicted CxxxxCH...CXXCH cytochrome family protein
MKRIIFIFLIILISSTGLFASDGKSPVVSIINPGPGTKASPVVVSLSSTSELKVQVQIWDDIPITSAQIGYCEDTGSTDPETCSFTFVSLTLNNNYSCGTGCGIYEAFLGLSQGRSYYLYARATSLDGTGTSRDRRTLVTPDNNPRYVYIKTLAPKTGTGTLLVRDFSSQLCIDCHNVMSHSSQSTSTKYENWQVVCLECHTPHATRNIFLMKEQILTPNSGLKEVRFYNKTGDATNSYVDSSAGANTRGICQVCHTQTIGNGVARWRNTGNSDASHYQSPSTQRCTNCHTHTKGFGAACDICHGYPPPPLASPPTGSTTQGAHQFHVTTKGYACAICHYQSVGTGTTHNNTIISIGFVDILGIYTGGSYDGQTTAYYESTHASTSVSKTGSKTCSNIYCHGGTMSPNGGLYTSPVWDAGTNAYSCGNVPNGACHGASISNPPTRGSHPKHVNSAVTGMQLSCSECHYNNSHVDGSIQWDFDEAGDTRLAGALYRSAASGSLSPVPSLSYGQCTNLYCHSDGRRDTATRIYRAPQWGSSGTGCNFCHGTGNPAGAPDYPNGGAGSATANSHYAHVADAGGSYQSTRCTWCHNQTTTNGTTVNTPPHLNQTIDVVLSSTYGGTYSLPGKTCSNVACHGTGTEAVAPQWGGDAKCTDCHRAQTLGDLRKVAGTGGDFVRPSRHVSNGTTTEIVTSLDCIVCHMEGDVTSTSADVKIDKNYHPMEPVANNIIHLRNVDNYTTGWAWPKNGIGATTADRNNMDRFCLSCHDSDTSADTIITLEPNGPGTVSWTYTGAASNYYNVVTDDGDTSYARTTTAGAYHFNTLDDIDSSITGTINSVTVYAVCRGEAANNKIRLALRIGGTNYDGATEHTLQTTYATYSQTWTTNPAGGAWTWTTINGMEAGVKSTAIATATRCTQIYVAVDAPGTNPDIGSGTKLVWGSNLGGASTITVNSTGTGLDFGPAPRPRRYTPWNSNATYRNTYEYSTIVTERNNRGMTIPDVRDDFNSQGLKGKGWASHHNLNIFPKRYWTNNTTYLPTAVWTNYVTKEGQTLNDPAVGVLAGLHCSDCHLNETNAHGSVNTRYMLSDMNGNDAKYTNGVLTTSTDVCVKCHNRNVYAQNATTTNASNSQFPHSDMCVNPADPTDADYKTATHLGNRSSTGDGNSGYGSNLPCLACHGGMDFGAIHGSNAKYVPGGQSGITKRYRFMSGGAMRFFKPGDDTTVTDSTWEKTGTAGITCYTISGADNFGSCTQHVGAKAADKNQTRQRLLEY